MNGVKTYIALQSFWVNPIHNLFVYKGQVFKCKEDELPMPDIENKLIVFEHYWSVDE